MKTRDMIKLLESHGWEFYRMRGDHRVFKKVGEPLSVTVPGKLNEEMPVGTQQSILRKAGLKNK